MNNNNDKNPSRLRSRLCGGVRPLALKLDVLPRQMLSVWLGGCRKSFGFFSGVYRKH